MIGAYQCIQAGTSNGPSKTWAANTAFVKGDQVKVGGNLYKCATGGTSGTVGPTGTSTTYSVWDGSVGWVFVATYGLSGTGASITDGTCLWKYVGVANATASGTSNGGGSSSGGIAYSIPTSFLMLNAPNVGQANDVGGFWMCAGPSYGAGKSFSQWNGCVVFRSTDNVTWNQWKAITKPAAMGTVQGTVPGPASGWEDWDMSTALTVTWNYDYGFESKTDLDVLNGNNVLLIGSEIIQFANVSFVNGDPTQTVFTRLLRGRQCTDSSIWTHASGETAIVIDTSAFTYCSDISERGMARYYRATTVGTDMASSNTVTFTNTSAGLMPYSPVQIKATFDGSLNRTLKWFRRSRVQGGWAESVDVPMAETTESYDIEFWNNGAVVRTVSGYVNSTPSAQPTITYSAANYAADYPSGLKIPLLLADTGAETTDWADWHISSGSIGVGHDTSSGVTPHAGTAMFLTGTASLNSMYQIVNMMESVTVDDLRQGLTLLIECYIAQTATNANTSSVVATFYDYAGTAIGTVTTGLQSFTGSTTWKYVSASGVIPVGARTVKVAMSTNVTAYTGSIYFDDLAISVTSTSLAQVIIYELSSVVGRGYPGSAVL